MFWGQWRCFLILRVDLAPMPFVTFRRNQDFARVLNIRGEATVQRHISQWLKTTLLLLWAIGVSAAQQEQKPEEKRPAPPVAPAARLAAAKTAFLKKAGGGAAPFDVVSSTLEGWGKFTLVEAPEKADIIIEVFSVEDTPATVSSSIGPSRETGRLEQTSHTSKQITIAQIRLTVYDAKTKVSLWTGTERPKGATKKIDRENNEVEAAQHLVSRFHDYVEPPPR